MDKMNNIGENIRNARRKSGLSQSQLSDLLNVSNTVISHWERGRNEPSLNTLRAISQILDVPIEELIGKEKEIVKDDQAIIIDREGILEMFHQLDDEGKEFVKQVINRELDRTRSKQKAIIFPMVEMSNMGVPKEEETVEFDYYPQAAGMGRGQDVTPSKPEKMEISVDKIPKYADYIIRVTGDSMEPTYSPGDLLFIQNTEVLNKGDIGVFVIEGETMVKELGDNELISHNEKYEPITSGDGCFIQGRVVGKYER